MKDDCIFCKIIAGLIPADRVFEDDDMLAFRDIQPKAPVHCLLVPKLHVVSLLEVSAEDAPLLGRLMARVPAIARAEGCTQGFRLIANTGPVGGQEVMHIHFHILGGSQPLGAMLPRSFTQE